MKYYNITVNGNTYQVAVEETNGAAVNSTPAYVSSPAPAPAVPVQQAQAPQAAPEVQPAASPAPASSSEGNTKIFAPMPGKIISTKVSVGQSVKKGDVLIILEAMKMENEIVSSHDGVVASVNVTVGQTIESNTLLVSLN